MRWTFVASWLGLLCFLAFVVWTWISYRRDRQRHIDELNRILENQKRYEEMKKNLKLIPLILSATLLTGCGMEQVDEGFRGIKTNMGKMIGAPLEPGLHFYNPITSDVFELDVRENKLEEQTAAFTRDTQTVTITFALTYYPDPTKIGMLYSQFGRDWAAKVIQQAALGSIKDVVGQYIADDLVGKREAAKQAAQTMLKASLAERHVIVTRLDFVNLDFDDAYEKAVEQKVVAVQRAAEAKNRTVQVEEEAKQVVAQAQADAEAMRIKSNALAQNKGLVAYELALKWDGKLPQYMFGSTVPMLNLDKVKGE
jgi:regulator of protease activity HflC (stomatin/prohibitin superfamily)